MISGLFVYPVKSFGGISLNESLVEGRGLQHDRRWMLVNDSGEFMTQRTDTRLALFRTQITHDGLIISDPNSSEIEVPFTLAGAVRTVSVWKDTVEAVQVSEGIDDWFSARLDQRCSLVYMPDSTVRQPNLEYSVEGDRVGFADAFPILVIGEASLADLNGRLEEDLPMNRFRGNIIVSGWEPFEEDRFESLQIGNLKLRAVKPCGRCSVTATNQETGEVGIEPLKTLATYRRGEKNVLFGAYFIPENEAQISVGDCIQSI